MRPVVASLLVIAAIFVSLLLTQLPQWRPRTASILPRPSSNAVGARVLLDASDASQDMVAEEPGPVAEGPGRKLTEVVLGNVSMYRSDSLIRPLSPVAALASELAKHAAVVGPVPDTVEDVRYHAGAAEADGQAVVAAMAVKYGRIQVAAGLEFATHAPPVLLYMRPDVGARWRALEAAAAATNASSGGASRRSRGDGRTVVRVACLFAGFVRDYENMLMRCADTRKPKQCSVGTQQKFYGNLRANVIEGLNCDVYASTWNIRGKGRFNVYAYDMSQVVPLDELQKAYGAQLAGLHVQNYSVYEPIWKYMHKYARGFPQIHGSRLANQTAGTAAFAGVPELNFLMRQNDYSQAYKHWCVVQLALLSQFPYDAFYRMRFDIRAIRRLDSLRFAVSAATGDETIKFRMLHRGGAASSHSISARRIHAQNFDISDFGFFGPVRMIEHLASVWYFCLAPAGTALRAGAPIAPQSNSDVLSEYNLMLWRIIFDSNWTVDSGNRYLYVSRRFGLRKQ